MAFSYRELFFSKTYTINIARRGIAATNTLIHLCFNGKRSSKLPPRITIIAMSSQLLKLVLAPKLDLNCDPEEINKISRTIDDPEIARIKKT